MVLSDFLSRQNNDDSDPHEIIHISFNMYKVLHKNYYNTKITYCKQDPKPDLVELNFWRFMAWERI